MPREEAEELVSKGRSKLRKAVVQLLADVGSASAKDIAYFTGARRKTLHELEEMGVITLYTREVFRRPELEQVEPQPRPMLNPEQQAAFQGLLKLEQSGADFMELEKLTLGSLRKAVMDGDVEYGTVMAGQIAGMVSKVQPCKDMIEEIVQEADRLLSCQEDTVWGR